MTAAVEIYNKPAFGYREETFALLMLNAWELLLKAKLLHENNNNTKAIRVYERRQLKGGSRSKKLYLRRNRSGNPVTLGLEACIAKLDSNTATRLTPAVKVNLEALREIRDNAAHFVHASPVLIKQVLEVGTASIHNFVGICRSWFQRDLSRSLSLMLPLAFIGGTLEAAVVSVSPDERNLITYLEKLASSAAESNDVYNVAVRLDVRLQRSRLDTASIVEVSSEPGAVKVTLSEEDIRQRYPWDYRELVSNLKDRYTDFKMNAHFHAIKKPLMTDRKLVRVRLLDPGNPRSQKKEFYSPNIFKIFDEHYTRK